ncbi:DMT family transporter [Lacticaseibacillus saniviri]|nr:DMT family transporter [Lacticaseibacillus saniviri]MCG4281029.1 DMT family transporter [Lacticaseibacillus saniviri]
MRKTIGYIVMSTFLFSSMEIVLKLAGGTFSALQLNFLRFLIGGLVLLPLAMKFLRQHQLRILPHWGIFALTGFVCVIVSMTFFQLAVENAPAATVAVLFSCNPVFALLFSYILLHETLSRTSIISVVISVIGLLIIINPAHLTNPFGLSLAVISAITFGLYSIISRWGSQKYHYNGIVMTTFTFLFGAAELLIGIGLSHLPVVTRALANPGLKDFVNIPVVQGISWSSLPMLAYIGIGVTGLGFAFYFIAMERSDVSTASLVFFIKPGLAPIMAAIILGERIPGLTIVGIVIILLGSVISFVGESFIERVDKMLPWHKKDSVHDL